MEDLPRFGFEDSDSKKESDSKDKKESKKSSDSTKTRSIGAFAKSGAEITPTHPDRKEVKKSLFGLTSNEAVDSGAKEDGIGSASDKETAEKKTVVAELHEDHEDKDIEAQKHKLLQAELDDRIAEYDEVIETTPVDSPEHIQAVAAKELDSKVKEKAEDPSVEHDPVIEAEYARQLAEIELPEEAEAESGPEETADSVEPEDTAADSLLEEDDEAEAEAPASTPPASKSGASWTAMPPTPPIAASSAPPLPPLPPRRPPGGGVIPLSSSPRERPTPVASQVNPNVLAAPPNASNEDERSQKAGAFLVGGLLGYMVGRRGGRKRTEKRLQPEIKSLNTELAATKKHLDDRERAIKAAAAQKLVEQQPHKPEKPTREEKPAPKPVAEILRQTIMAPEQPHTALPEYRAEVPALAPKPETPKPQPRATEIAPEAALKRVEQLSTPALLKSAETLFVEGVSVRRLYETNRIDRRGLVAIVQEGLRGGNVAATFEKVELGHERQVERAREFRHDDPGFISLTADDTQAAPPRPPTLAAHSMPSESLPNTPNKESLQPLSSPHSASPRTEQPPVTTGSVPANTPIKLSRGTPELKLAAVAAIAITFLILWVIFG